MGSSINFAMHKIKPGTFAAGTVKIYFKGTIERCVAMDNAFSFMSSVKGTPAYWKQFLYDVLAMVKQLGIPMHLLTLSCAYLRWKELPYIINKLNNLGLNGEELKNSSYQERFNLLNNNPVHVARHFRYKVEVFLKVNVIDLTKDNFTQPLSVKKILDELEISMEIITELCQYQKMKI